MAVMVMAVMDMVMVMATAMVMDIMERKLPKAHTKSIRESGGSFGKVELREVKAKNRTFCNRQTKE
jgi:hypothetical protein